MHSCTNVVYDLSQEFLEKASITFYSGLTVVQYVSVVIFLNQSPIYFCIFANYLVPKTDKFTKDLPNIATFKPNHLAALGSMFRLIGPSCAKFGITMLAHFMLFELFD